VNVKTTDGSITVGTASSLNGVSANGTGQVVLTANGSGSDINVNQAISSGSGEVNLKAADSVALAANVGTTGNAFVEATAGSISRTAGTLSATAAALTAGGSIGSSGNAVQTQVDQLGITTGQNAYVADANSVTASAQSSGSGTVSITANTGTLTVQNLSIAPAVSGNAAGYSLAGTAGVSGAGNVALVASNAGAAQGVVVNDSVTAAGQVAVTATSAGQTAIQVADNISAGNGLTLTGSTTDGTNAIALASGVQLANAGGITRLEAAQGNISAPASLASRASINQGAGAGAVQIVAGSTASSAGSIDASQLSITQNGAGGVLMQTTGTGDLTVGQIVNNGNGSVVLSAGSALAAGDGTGGQVNTVAGNSVTQAATGKTYVYTGNANDTGLLSNLDNGFATLYLSSNAGGSVNATSNTAYASGPVANGGANSQVMFRERVAVDTQGVSQAQLQVTYGDVDPSNQAVVDALRLANTTTVLTTTSNAATFKIGATEVINNNLTATLAAPTRAYRDVNTYNYTIAPDTPNYTTFSSNTSNSSATLQVSPKQLTASLVGSVSKTYDSNTNATLAAGNFSLSGFVSGEGASVTQTAGTYASPNVNANGGTGAVSASLLPTHLNANTGTLLSNYSLPTTASGNVGTITPAALTVKVGDTMAFVTQDARTAIDTGVSYTGLQGADTAASALVRVPVANDRTYTGNTLTPLVGSYSGVYDLGFTPTAQHGNYTVTVQKGNLQVIPADKLLITIASQSDTYGNRGAGNAGQASGVTAQYCLAPGNCNGANIFSLSMSAGSGNSWSGSDNTNTTVTFDTTVNTSGNLSGADFLKAGNYNWGVANLNANNSGQFSGYEVNSGTLAVGRLAITPTANAVSKVYDGTQSAAGVTLNTAQALAGDAVSATAGSGSYSTKNVITNDTVTFGNLSLQGADQNNYAIAVSTVQGSGSITPKALTLAAVTDSKTYDGTTRSGGTVAVTGLVGTDTVSSASQSFDSKNVLGTNGSTLRVNAGYAVNDGNGGNNYKLTTTTAAGTISPLAATVTASGARKFFTGLLQSLDPAQTTGFLSADQITISGLATGTTPGSYTSQLSAGGADARNYSVTYQNATLEILPVGNALNLFKTIDNPNVRPETRIAYRGFSATGAAVGGKNAAIAEASCTPENDSNCTCEVNPELKLEICLPSKDRQR
jgi:hypothetical protein